MYVFVAPPQNRCKLTNSAPIKQLVSLFQENVKSDTASEQLSPVALGKQLEYLQHQLTDLHLEKLLGPDASIDLSDPQGALQK